jgi:acyl transferase domain-containing protein
MSKTETGYEIAVIGMAAKFPKARNIDAFWDNLVKGVGSVSFFTDEELRETGIEPTVYNEKNYIRAKAYLEDAEYFDAGFFDYAPDEARIMDPQVRLLHEVTYEAIEDAGYNPYDYKGLIGFYAGAFYNHYWEAAAVPLVDESKDKFEVVHFIDKDFLNSRVSYKLNLRGPSVSLSTACSTSLASIHLACRSLLTGECTIALAGGVTLYLPQKAGYVYKEPSNLSRDGQCRPFDAQATGFLPGEGVGMVALKLLSNALADGDHIYAVIKGSAINNDGANKAGYATPSIEGPVNAIKAALRFSKVEPESISYIEAHGTGTYLGDQLEFETLRTAYTSNKKGYCRIGSHKSNIGYLGPASGVASFIKTALSLYHKQIPPLLNFKSPNPHLDVANSPFLIDSRLHEWNGNGHPLRAGINNISVGGTNVHVILEEAPRKEENKPEQEYKIIPLAARTYSALETVTKNMSDYLQKRPDVNLSDVAYTLQTGKKAFEYRRSFVCSDIQDALDSLLTLNPEKVRTYEPVREDRPVIFLFPDQEDFEERGILELYKKNRTIRKEIDTCLLLCKNLTGLDLGAKIFSNDHLTELEYEEVACIQFIAQYALARFLQSLNVKPDGMMGRGTGEYVAACISGVFSLPDALKTVNARSGLVKKLPQAEAVRVSLTKDRLLPFLTGELSIECELTSSKCIVTGPPPDLERFSVALKEGGHRATKLLTKRAYSLAHVCPSLQHEFQAIIESIPLNRPEIPCVSSLSGAWFKANEMASPAYWLNHLSQPLNIKDGIGELLRKQNAVFIEIGSGKSLAALINQHEQKKKEQASLNVLKGPKDSGTALVYLLDKIGKLWGEGVKIDWIKLYDAEKRNLLSLPTYPFEKHRFPVPILRSDR